MNYVTELFVCSRRQVARVKAIKNNTSGSDKPFIMLERQMNVEIESDI